MFKDKGQGRTPDRLIATDEKGNDFILPLDLPDVAEELTAHIRRLLDDGDELVIIRAERTQSLREELAETQGRLVMLQSQITAIEEDREGLRKELSRKEGQLGEVQRMLASVGAALQGAGADTDPEAGAESESESESEPEPKQAAKRTAAGSSPGKRQT